MSKRNNFSVFFKDNLPLIGLILSYPIFIAVSIFYYVLKVFRTDTKNHSVAGQVAVITGSAGGLGRELAIELAKRGCHIAIVDVQKQLAEETAEYIAKTYNVKTKPYKVDVTSYQQLTELEAKITEDLGDTTILINNAGILMLSSVLNPPHEEISRMINVNITAICYTTQIFLPKMKQLNYGHIANISSMAALTPMPILNVYAATKVAVRLLTSMLRMELMHLRHNITATTVMPSFMNTNKHVEKLLTLGRSGKLVNITNGGIVAQQIVDGMLRGEDEITIPNSGKYIYKLMELLPTYVKERFYVLLTDRSYQPYIRSTRVSNILKDATGVPDVNNNSKI